MFALANEKQTAIEEVVYTLIMRTGFVEKTGKIEDMNRDFDREFWQTQSDTQRFAAAWELVVQAFIIQEKDVSGLRLQKTVEHFGQLKER
jgi:hypothetical protein